LQEVVGENKILPKKFQTWVDNQHEFSSRYSLAGLCILERMPSMIIDIMAMQFLSKYPIVRHDVIDLTIHAKEMRALLYCEIDHPHGKLDLFCTHLNLLHRHRVKQYEIINKSIKELHHQKRPLILAGDFNDWIKKSYLFLDDLEFAAKNYPNKTFPPQSTN
jgi:endonuclease/exonuclease/phosphatase family metal-dependent hydrolase